MNSEIQSGEGMLATRPPEKWWRRKLSDEVAILLLLVLIGGPAIVFVMNPPGRQQVKKANTANNAGQVAKAYLVFDAGKFEPRAISLAEVASHGGGVTGFAVNLAIKGGFNDARLWYQDCDDKLNSRKGLPFQVADLTDPKNPKADSAFAALKPKAWAVVVSIPPKVNAAHYPVLWSRGLRGTRWERDSAYKGEGGVVAYLDGHAEWVADTLGEDGKGVFVTPDGRRTASVEEAIGPGAVVLED